MVKAARHRLPIVCDVLRVNDCRPTRCLFMQVTKFVSFVIVRVSLTISADKVMEDVTQEAFSNMQYAPHRLHHMATKWMPWYRIDARTHCTVLVPTQRVWEWCLLHTELAGSCNFMFICFTRQATIVEDWKDDNAIDARCAFIVSEPTGLGW